MTRLNPHFCLPFAQLQLWFSTRCLAVWRPSFRCTRTAFITLFSDAAGGNKCHSRVGGEHRSRIYKTKTKRNRNCNHWNWIHYQIRGRTSSWMLNTITVFQQVCPVIQRQMWHGGAYGEMLITYAKKASVQFIAIPRVATGHNWTQGWAVKTHKHFKIIHSCSCVFNSLLPTF